jgi:hypothetical protein
MTLSGVGVGDDDDDEKFCRPWRPKLRGEGRVS